MALNREIIDISSDEEDEHPVRRLFTFLKKLKKENQIRNNKLFSSTSDDEDDCVILDGDPDKPVRVAADDNNIKENACFSDDDLLIVAEKGQVACRDYPHARHVCATFPFDTNPHEKYCDMCHCYVCDTRAPCVYWGTGESSGDHCHSTDKEEMWRLQRQSGATLSDVPPLHSAPSCSQPINSGEERGSLSGLRSALDRLTVQADRLTGRIKWFDRQKGYGFICPDGGGEDLFIHKSAIKCEEYRCLAGEVVEFQIESYDGKKKAIDVNIPGVYRLQHVRPHLAFHNF